MNNFQKNISIENVSSTNQNNDRNAILFSSIKQTYHLPGDMMQDGSDGAGNGADELSMAKKRKLCDMAVPARTQASWIRGAAK